MADYLDFKMAGYLTVIDSEGETDSIEFMRDTPEEKHKAIVKHANKYFVQNEDADEYHFCVVDFERNISTIYEFTCKREIVLECTAY